MATMFQLELKEISPQFKPPTMTKTMAVQSKPVKLLMEIKVGIVIKSTDKMSKSDSDNRDPKAPFTRLLAGIGNLLFNDGVYFSEVPGVTGRSGESVTGPVSSEAARIMPWLSKPIIVRDSRLAINRNSFPVIVSGS